MQLLWVKDMMLWVDQQMLKVQKKDFKSIAKFASDFTNQNQAMMKTKQNMQNILISQVSIMTVMEF